MEYSEEVRRRFAAPGRIASRDAAQGLSGAAEDRALGVWARFHIRARGDVIQAVCYHVFGCPHTIAAASLVAELLEGEPLVALRLNWAQQLAARLAVPAEKTGRLLVLENALRACASNCTQGC